MVVNSANTEWPGLPSNAPILSYYVAHMQLITSEFNTELRVSAMRCFMLISHFMTVGKARMERGLKGTAKLHVSQVGHFSSHSVVNEAGIIGLP